MSAPLHANQVLTRVYDPATNALRTVTIADEPKASARAVLSALAASIVSQIALAASPRIGAIAVNKSESTCFIAYAATASSTLFTYQLTPGSTWIMDDPIYTGIISAIWLSANGSLQITELFES